MSRALRALRSLWLVSPSVLPALDIMAGSLDGGFRPDGRMFSSCDCGRSMMAILSGCWAMLESCVCCKSTSIAIQAMSHGDGSQWIVAGNRYVCFGKLQGKHRARVARSVKLGSGLLHGPSESGSGTDDKVLWDLLPPRWL